MYAPSATATATSTRKDFPPRMSVFASQTTFCFELAKGVGSGLRQPRPDPLLISNSALSGLAYATKTRPQLISTALPPHPERVGEEQARDDEDRGPKHP